MRSRIILSALTVAHYGRAGKRPRAAAQILTACQSAVFERKLSRRGDREAKRGCSWR
jgi:hypothetical protein